MDALRSLTKYRIIEKLGEGGMGEVYKAEDRELMRLVAIKVMSKRSRRLQDAEKRFLREARAASAINHPNIVTIHEIGETEECAYMVMEYVSGRSLGDLIEARALSADVIIEIALQICDALIEAHSRQIIHRDIKPENVIVNERGRVKLLDFGLAKMFKAEEFDAADPTYIKSLTESGAIVGTPSYMSPEQLRGESLDLRTDVFSFGVMLYRMIAGRFPFSGATSIERAAATLKDDAIEIKELPSGLPREIISVVMRCLEKNREDRYGSFADVKRDLAAVFQEPSRSMASPGECKRHTVKPASEARSSPAPSSTHTILVLPLEDLSAKEQSSFIGTGLAHAITTSLAKIKPLSVLSKSVGAGRTQAGRDAREVARELGATILLEGEIIRSENKLGVMARLTDVESGRFIWGDHYRGDASDLFSIHDAVCESVAAAMQISLSSDLRRRIARPAANIDAFELYSKGRAFLERHDIKTNRDYAIRMFEEALKLDPDFALAHAGLGEAYWRKYQDTRESDWIERAIAANARALSLDPNQAQAHISLGIVYQGTGKTDEAIGEFERASELQPLSDDAFRWLGRCYMRKGDMERAVACFETAIRIRPGYYDNYNDLGSCYYTFGQYSEASEQFRRVITIQPDNFQGYNNLGAMYYFLGRYEQAVDMYKRALDIQPNGDAYTNLGTTYFYLGRYEDAIGAYKAAIGLNPTDEILYRNLGDAYLRVGKKREAEQQYETAINMICKSLDINPDDGERLADMAICQAKLRRDEDAMASIERATALEPRNINFMYGKAVVHALTGRTDLAIECLSRAVDNGYSRSEIERDPDLETLRNEPEYLTLFADRK